jgi:dTDP-4-amino-4,6-dideoxygalactose transaminase
MKVKPTYVTQPALAPLDEYVELLKGVWERGILTHNGPLVQQFEKEIKEELGTNNFVAVSNGTIALQMAIKALGLKGEIITTPFTWIATISAIKWEDCTPIFCDIDPETFNIDPSKIENLITDNTVAIMPVHVFGNPCDVDAIGTIAKKYKLKVIYDAAHAIGSMYKGKSLLSFGDISATSLHATKLLNTAEGGGCITQDVELHERLKRIRFFGHDETKDVVEDGFNGKMTEIHAALGIANLKYYNQVIADRKVKYNAYLDELSNMEDITFQKIKYGEANHSYFPILLHDRKRLEKIEELLVNNNIHPRRYFYPSVNKYGKILEYTELPISESTADKILCLPLYYGIEPELICRIAKLISKS